MISLDAIAQGLQQQVNALEEEVRELKDEIAEKDNQCQIYKNELEDTKPLMEAASKQIMNLQHVEAELRQQLAEVTLKAEKIDHAKKTSDRALQQTVIRLGQNSKMVQDTIRRQDDSALQQQVQYLRDENSAQKALIGDYERSMSQLQQKIKDAELGRLAADTRAQLAEESIRGYQDQLGAAQAELERLTFEMQSAVKSSQLSSILELSEFQMPRPQNQYKLEFFQMQLQQSETRAQKLEQLLEEAQYEVLEQRKRAQDAEQKTTRREETIQQLQMQAELARAQREAEIKALQKQLDTMEQFQQKLIDCQQPQQMGEVIGQYKNFVLDMHDKLDRHMRENTTQQLQTTLQHTQQVQAVVQRPVVQQTGSGSEVELCKLEIQQLKALNQKYIQQIAELGEEILQLQRDAAKMRQKEVAFDARAVDAQQRIELLEGKLRQLEGSDAKVADVKQKCKEQLTKFKQIYEKTIREYQRLLQSNLAGGAGQGAFAQQQMQQKLLEQIETLADKIGAKSADDMELTPQAKTVAKIQQYEKVLAGAK